MPRRTRRLFCFTMILALLSLLLTPIVPNAQLPAVLAQDDVQRDPQPQGDGRVEVDSQLSRALAADETGGYMIAFDEHPDLSAAYGMSWQERGRYVVSQLQETATRSQRRAAALLKGRGARFKSYWAGNVIVVERSSRAAVEGLRQLGEIRGLYPAPEIVLFDAAQRQEVTSVPSAPLGAVEINIARIKAPNVWALGYRGEGIVVGLIDSGVRYTHQGLVGQYRGKLGGGGFDHSYSWWDAFDKTSAPYDAGDHGTHVAGIMVGDGPNQFGVAPGAKWMSCLGSKGGAGNVISMTECGQFMLAPWDLNKQNPNPDKRPHVVNNSWGSCERSYSGWYQYIVDAWLAAGIYPVFAAGNAGNCGYSTPPGLNTVGTPARYGNVTAVGSTSTSSGLYATHSNWGPGDVLDSVNPRGYPNLKPQVVAPGVGIGSSVSSSDSAYAMKSGTSMSAPHVSGVVALMWQAAPCLQGKYASTETLLEQSATPIAYPSGNGDEGPGNVPNHATGWGEVNALKAVQLAQQFCARAGLLQGRVADAATGLPLANVPIIATLSPTQTWGALSDAQGAYTLTVTAGSYSVSASSFGYYTRSDSAVLIAIAATTAHDLPLTPIPRVVVSGTVRDDSGHGWPLYARISMSGPSPQQAATTFTDPATGAYSVALVPGAPYTLTVIPVLPGYQEQTRDVTLVADQSLDFLLKARNVCDAPGYMRDYSYVASFEGSDDGYTVSGSNPSWAWGMPASGPGVAHSGSRAWATNLGGSYNANEQSSLTSPPIDLSAYAGRGLVLSWWQSIALDDRYGGDWAAVEVSKDAGASWTRVYDSISERTDDRWASMQVALDSTYAVAGFQVRFLFASDRAGQYEGWYIDDVGVEVKRPSIPSYGTDFELDDGGLVSSGRFPSWEWGVPGYLGGPAAHSGSKVMATNLDGNYYAGELSRLTLSLDLSAHAGAVIVSWWEWYSLGSGDSLRLEASKDGSTFVALSGGRTGSSGGWVQRTMTLSSSYATDMFRFSFVLDDASVGASDGWYIDDLTVSIDPGPAPCVASPSALLFGTVSDANTGLSVNGASIRASGTVTRTTTSSRTPTDSALPDGLYLMVVPETGAVVLTGSYLDYSGDQQHLLLENHSVVRQDLVLRAPLAAFDQQQITLFSIEGQQISRTLTLANAGDMATQADLWEYLGSNRPAYNPAVKLSSGVRVLPWAEVGNLALLRFSPAATLADDAIYVFGGLNKEVQSSVQRYSLADGTWQTDLPPLPVALSDACAVTLDDDIYLLGGLLGGAVVTSTVQVYHTGPSSWKLLTSDPMPEPRRNAVCATHGGKLYLFGGASNGNAVMGTTWVYDPAAELGSRWSASASLPKASFFGGAATVGDAIFYAGMRHPAESGVRDVYAYWPLSDTWTLYPQLPIARERGMTWALDGKIYVGGGDGSTAVYTYDMAQGHSGGWTSTAPLPYLTQGGIGLVDTARKLLYAVGGSSSFSLAHLPIALDVPWLSASPLSSLLSVRDQIPISLTIDTRGLASGRYEAQLLATLRDTPYALAHPAMTVTLQVAQVGLEVAPISATLFVLPGRSATHSLTITNTGDYTDSFTLAAGAHGWPVTPTLTVVGPLAPGASATLALSMGVPRTAPEGAQETLSLTLRSTLDQRRQRVVTRTTRVTYHKIYLSLVQLSPR